ncbi:MAG TPA: hypothetical protein VG013_06970 [Gemmataceae bacterium]|jgi:hypothetical protein|nr:hypothetical protein [Gemmataceae bacterium]
MAASFQRQSLQRKLIYTALILVLFTATLAVRTADFSLGGYPVRGLFAQAKALELREQDVGEADLLGSTLMLTLTGSRGMVVCGLWWDATDLQARHEWNELELRIRLLTKLQPHFITPWLYQSWNLAYNVSVESDRINDKYFYVSRGMELLADGERRNRDNPDLRFNMGTYHQDKLGNADENKTFRCLFQISCIDPLERDPAKFLPDPANRYVVDLDAFETFCKAHPFLVRRLRDGLNKKTPLEVVRFLADNKKIPNRFQDRTEQGESSTPLKPPEERFPILPPRSQYDPDEPLYRDVGQIPDYLADNFVAARSWFSYAQDPLSMPQPRQPRLRSAIFRSYPARAQAYLGERLEHEGWFDLEGWQIKDWFPRNKSQPNGAKTTVTVGADHDNWWAAEAWEKAYQMYRDYGRRARILVTPAEQRLLTPQELAQYHYDFGVTNYAHWLESAKVERLKATVLARKYFYVAEQLRHAGGRPAEVIQVYEDPAAFGPPSMWDKKPTGWKKVFLDHPAWRADSDVQEETYQIEQKYLAQVQKRYGSQLSQAREVADSVLQAAAARPGVPLWLPCPVFGSDESPWPFTGPFDGVDAQKQPLITDEAKQLFQRRPAQSLLRSRGPMTRPRTAPVPGR